MLSIFEPIAWGRCNEANTCLAYVKMMNSDGHPGLRTSKAGFVVDINRCWLGASPDAWVFDPSVDNPQGIVEFKCPYSKREETPEKACKDKIFYYSIADSKLHLDHTHTYYYDQVQLQLLVTKDKCHWCDFCV